MRRDCYKLDDGHRGDKGSGRTIFFTKSKKKPNAANGCMAAFYQLFDFQQFYFSSNHLTIDSPSRSKDLRLIEESQPSTTSTSMRVRTETCTTMSARLRALATDNTSTTSCSSEICNSPGSKTPNLVARLMGLDLLPDKTEFNHHSLTNLHHGSSRFTSHRLSKKGTRSLPVSPRISSSRNSDFDFHRLSLQLNKDFGSSRLKEMKQEQDENRSPRDYARQLVKQIKERVVTRRVVGMDITESVKNRETRPSSHHELRRDTTVSCSPRTRFSNKENKPSTIHKPNPSSSFRPEQITKKLKPTTMILVPLSKPSGEKQSQSRVKQKQLRSPINQCKKPAEIISETKFTQRTIKPSSPTQDIQIKKQARDVKVKPLHKNKVKKIPMSNDLVNISATRPPQRQINERDGMKANIEASSHSSLMEKDDKNSQQVTRNYKLDDEATDSEKDYITRLMKLVGNYECGTLSLQCNRRLLFDLVTETEELYMKRRRICNESELISELCSAVASKYYCPVPEEIALLDNDHILETKKNVEDEREDIIAEIEREIIEALVVEAVSELCHYVI